MAHSEQILRDAFRLGSPLATPGLTPGLRGCVPSLRWYGHSAEHGRLGPGRLGPTPVQHEPNSTATAVVAAAAEDKHVQAATATMAIAVATVEAEATAAALAAGSGDRGDGSGGCGRDAPSARPIVPVVPTLPRAIGRRWWRGGSLRFRR